MKIRRLQFVDARRHLGDVINRARYTGEPTLITVYGHDGAVVVGPEWYSLRRTDEDPQLGEPGSLPGENGRE